MTRSGVGLNELLGCTHVERNVKSNVKAKTVHAKLFWAVAYGDGRIDPYTIRHKRAEAIDAFCDAPFMSDWPEWRKKGARPVKVLVQPN